MAHVLAKDLRDAVLLSATKGELTRTLESDTRISETISLIKSNKKDYKWEKGKKKITINPITDKEYELVPTRYNLIRLGEAVSLLGRIGFRGFVKEDFVEKSDFICLNPGNLLPSNKMSYSKLSYIRKEKFIESPEIQIKNGDILMVKTGSSYGKCAIVENYNKNATINPQLVRIVSHGVNIKYLLYVFGSKIGKDQFESFVTGTATPTFSQEKLANFLVPLPPIEEQARIVAKVDELMAKIDEYEKLEKELTELKEKFPGEMRDAILQSALMGNITSQLENDSSTKLFLKKIKNYRKELIEKKEIKNISIATINEENYPYDIPQNWEWERIGNIEEINLGFTYKPSYVENGVYFLSVKDISNGKIDFSKAKKVSQETYDNASYGSKPKKGDILFGRVCTMGKPQIIETDIPFCIFVSLGFFRDHSNLMNKKYVAYWMESILFNQQVNENVKGAAQKNLNTGWLKDFLIPIPPIEEQQRIVDKLDKLLPMCDELANLC